MGGVLNAVGSVVGGLAGGIAEGAGATNSYQAGNPYNSGYLKQAIDQQNGLYNQQQSLAQALQNQMNGQGPNPAQIQYMANQQAGLANAQGLIASQRGLNPALAARMGANAAAVSNQQASLGSALLQQQQQLAATNNLQNLYGQMNQTNLGQQQLYNNVNLGAAGLNQQTAGQNANIRGQVAGGLLNAGGGAAGAALAAAHGAIVPGKANVDGDSPENDTVHAMLSPGEIVIPRSKAHDPEKAKEFIDHLLKSKEKPGGYGEIVAARRKKGKK